MIMQSPSFNQGEEKPIPRRGYHGSFDNMDETKP